MIVKPADTFAGEFEVTFLKCSQKSVTASLRLPAPTVMGGTTHTKKI